VDQIGLALRATAGMYATLSFRAEAMQAAADAPGAAATDLAEHLVRAGTPFRDAHGIVGALVREALDGPRDLRALVEAHPKLGSDAARLLDPGVPVTQRTTRGGAGPEPVIAQVARFRERLAADRARVGQA
jgi:argininosuccinate lyase